MQCYIYYMDYMDYMDDKSGAANSICHTSA